MMDENNSEFEADLKRIAKEMMIDAVKDEMLDRFEEDVYGPNARFDEAWSKSQVMSHAYWVVEAELMNFLKDNELGQQFMDDFVEDCLIEIAEVEMKLRVEDADVEIIKG